MTYGVALFFIIIALHYIAFGRLPRIPRPYQARCRECGWEGPRRTLFRSSVMDYRIHVRYDLPPLVVRVREEG